MYMLYTYTVPLYTLQNVTLFSFDIYRTAGTATYRLITPKSYNHPPPTWVVSSWPADCLLEWEMCGGRSRLLGWPAPSINLIQAVFT